MTLSSISLLQSIFWQTPTHVCILLCTFSRKYTGVSVSVNGGGLDIRSTDIETLTPSTDIEVASVSVLLGLNIRTKERVSVSVMYRIPRPQCILN